MTSPLRRFALAATLSILPFILLACGDEADSTPTTVHEYTVRGIVRALPDAARPGSELYVHHEAIPNFVNDRGEAVGMDSMAMPFPVPDPTILDGFAIGDRVDMRFEVEWDGSPPLRVVGLDPLPADTVLDFEVPTEPTDSAEGTDTDAPDDPATDDADPSGDPGHHDHHGSQGDHGSTGDHAGMHGGDG
ncbi:MAG: copper-binding protein [Acidobacteriota bacterium]